MPVVARALTAPGMASRLVGPFRVAGVVFLSYLALGHLPALFALPAGPGDIADPARRVPALGKRSRAVHPGARPRRRTCAGRSRRVIRMADINAWYSRLLAADEARDAAALAAVAWQMYGQLATTAADLGALRARFRVYAAAPHASGRRRPAPRGAQVGDRAAAA